MNVYEYSSPNEFLRAVVSSARKNSSALSVEELADRIGIGRSTFKMILCKRRRMTTEHLHLVAQAFGLSSAEVKFLQGLILKDRSKSRAERRFQSKDLAELKKEARLHSFPVAAKNLLSDPYALPILVYLTDCHFKKSLSLDLDQGAIRKIAARFAIENSRVQEIVDLLCKLDLLPARNDHGEIHFVFNKVTQLMHQKSYLQSWLGEAARRIETDYASKESFFNTSTLTIEPENLPKLIADIKALVESYMAKPAPSENKMIVQVATQLFPL